MLILLSRKCISKSRPLLTQSQSQSLTTTTSPPPQQYPSFSIPLLTSNLPPNFTVKLRQAVGPFKAWFQTAKNPLLDQIFLILTSRDDDDLSSVRSADSALSSLPFRLSESFVLHVLKYGTDVLSCLKFFDWAGRQHGFNHTRATYHAIFKILSRAKHIPLMLGFLDAFNSQRYVYKARFYDTLVIGYAVAGKPELALELLARMRFQGLDLDQLAYNVLLNGLVEEELFDAVEAVLDQMQMRGHVNVITHSIVMKRFCKEMRFGEAEEYLRRLVTAEEVADGYGLRVLVDALCKGDRLDDAARLVEEFRELGCVPMGQAYDVWIRGLVRCGKTDVALGFLQELKVQEGYVPEVFRYNMLIFRLLKEQRLMEVFDMLTEMWEHQIVPDRVTMNAVMCFFCKAGMVDVALDLYRLKSEFRLTPNSMVYNYLVNSLCGYGNIDEAFHILKSSVENGQFRGASTFWMLADALCSEGKFDKMMQLLGIALDHNLKPHENLYNKLISALCRAKRVEDGYLIHGELNRLNGVTTDKTYSHMISGFNRLDRGDMAARLLIEMQEKGHSPTRRLLVRTVVQCLLNMQHVEGEEYLIDMQNLEQGFFQLLEMQLQFARSESACYTYNLFIDAAGHVRNPDLARKVFELMRGNGVEPNLDSEILMLQSYLKSEKIADALTFFHEVGERRVIKRKMYSTMVIGLCKANRADCALEIMSKVSKNGLVPSLNCYEELIHLLCNEGQYDKAVQLFNEMEKTRVYLSTFIGNVFLLHSWKSRGKSRDLYEAWIRSRDSSHETPSSGTLGDLVATFSCEFRSDCQVEHMEEAIQECFPLDVFTYNMLLKRLCNDRIDDAFGLFFRMCRKGYEPNKWTYEILAHGLCKHGRRAEAVRLVEEMYILGFHRSKGTNYII